MAVSRISRLRDCGVFRDWTWPSNLLDFSRYNLIYGWNGTGKTTLSRVFRALELRRPPTVGEAVLRIDGGDVRNEYFPQSTLQIRVFNRDFVNESVFPVGGSELPPIFIVGKESVERQKEADRLRDERSEKEKKLDDARQVKERTEGDLDKHCIDRARVIKDTLQKTGSAYNNYNKTDYKNRAQKMAADGDAASHRLSDEQREGLLAQHQATRKPKVSEVTYQVPALKVLADQVAEILRTTVVSSAIQALKDDSALAEWVRHGLVLHKERKSYKCLFCEQPLPEDRLVKLEAHFNAEYERFLQRVEEQIQALKSAEKQAAEVRLPNRAELYEYLQNDFDKACKAFERERDTVRKYISELVKDLKRKRDTPFETLTRSEAVPSVDAATLDRLNGILCRHNQACDGFDSRVRDARDRLALNMIAESLDDFVRLRDAVQTATAAVGQIEDEIGRLTAEIERLEREIREHHRPAEELNKELKRYLGHGELQLAIKDTGYSIARNGKPAYMLSEGETTAIALLYFLKSLEDRGFDKANGVVVLDDPVSSLDANALYLAFGFIRERTEDAGQLFILTHNFNFFRQVRNWFHYLKNQNKRDLSQRPARFYMLDCLRDGEQRCAAICQLDRFLEEYESEYHYLFARVHRATTSKAPATLEQNYMLPNMARRLLESFLAFRQPATPGDLWQKMEGVTFEEGRKLRILRFLHTYSHSDAIGEPEHDPSLLAEAGSVLTDLMELIQAQDKAHYDEMIKLVNHMATEGDEE